MKEFFVFNPSDQDFLMEEITYFMTVEGEHVSGLVTHFDTLRADIDEKADRMMLSM